ncbi:hypothetical protein A2U01_0056382, partial [Trifolium medium]|nr:hypothetical protein [Trifolium medium]
MNNTKRKKREWLLCSCDKIDIKDEVGCDVTDVVACVKRVKSKGILWLLSEEMN